MSAPDPQVTLRQIQDASRRAQDVCANKSWMPVFCYSIAESTSSKESVAKVVA